MQILNHISDIADQYDAFILDIFGVIHDGIQPFPDTVHTLQSMKEAGKQVCLLSNSPRLAVGATSQMERMGVARELYDEILTSGQATHDGLGHYIKTYGKRCWFIGNDVMAEVLQGHDIDIKDGPEHADFILNSIPGTDQRTVEELEENLKISVAAGLPMICANPDLVVNIGEHQYECAGTFAKLYEDMGGSVTYHGKPHGPVYERCHELLGGIDKSRILAIGDSFHTDIAGANHFGIDSAFNLTGIHWEEVLCDIEGTPSDEKIIAMAEGKSEKPTYVTTAFRW